MLLLLAGLAGANGPELPAGLDAPCATPERWAAIAPEPPRFPPPPEGLGDRDAFGTPNVLRSEHFAARWGTARPVQESRIQALLEAFEDGWEVEIEQMGHTRPYGTDSYYFNVYIGDTGDGAPPGYRAGGYYTTDREGWPMIVVAADTLGSADFADITAVHEFYHAIQGATRRYDYAPDGPSAWFWEATATWASSQVYADNPAYASFLFGYALYPHKRVNFFDYPNEGILQEYYQYGAFLWPLHLSDRTGSWDVVRDAWEDSGTEPDPLEVMRANLAADGRDLDALWLDHIARNVTWDYPDGGVYRQVMARYSSFREYQNLTAGTIPDEGTDGWVDGPSQIVPERYGSNTFEMSLPDEGTYTFEVEGDERGSGGNFASYGATLVVERPGEPVEYLPLVFDGVSGSLEVTGLDDAVRVYLVVGAWSVVAAPTWLEETFPIRYRVGFEPPAEDVPDEVVDDAVRGPCGCATDGAVGWVMLVPLALLWARRRR